MAPVPNLGLVSVPFICIISLSKSYFTKFRFLLLEPGSMALLICSTALETPLTMYQILSLFQSFRAPKTPAEAPLGRVVLKNLLRVRQLPQQWDSCHSVKAPMAQPENRHG